MKEIFRLLFVNRQTQEKYKQSFEGSSSLRLLLNLKNQIYVPRSSPPEVFCNKGVLRNFIRFAGKHLRKSLWHRCFPVKFLQTPEACNFIKKEYLAQVFFCEFCKISKNIFSYRTPSVAASVYPRLCIKSLYLLGSNFLILLLKSSKFFLFFISIEIICQTLEANNANELRTYLLLLTEFLKKLACVCKLYLRSK